MSARCGFARAFGCVSPLVVLLRRMFIVTAAFPVYFLLQLPTRTQNYGSNHRRHKHTHSASASAVKVGGDIQREGGGSGWGKPEGPGCPLSSLGRVHQRPACGICTAGWDLQLACLLPQREPPVLQHARAPRQPGVKEHCLTPFPVGTQGANKGCLQRLGPRNWAYNRC